MIYSHLSRRKLVETRKLNRVSGVNKLFAKNTHVRPFPKLIVFSVYELKFTWFLLTIRTKTPHGTLVSSSLIRPICAQFFLSVYLFICMFFFGSSSLAWRYNVTRRTPKVWTWWRLLIILMPSNRKSRFHILRFCFGVICGYGNYLSTHGWFLGGSHWLEKWICLMLQYSKLKSFLPLTGINLEFVK